MHSRPAHPSIQGLTVDHVLDGFFILLAQVNQTGLSFAKLVATGSVEESRP